MTDQSQPRRFADSLQRLEANGNLDDLCSQFTDDAELLRPEAHKGHSSSDPEAFWRSYLDQFSDIRTEFTHIIEGDDHAALEWTSRGTLSAGRSIEYQGVSLLSYDQDGRVRRFATYYDTAAFLEPTA